MDNQLDLRQIGTIFGHALYVDLAGVMDITKDGEILSERDLQEYKVRTTIQEAFGMPPSKATMIEEAPLIQSVCPMADCKAVYTSRYSPELNHFPEGERKNILKKAYANQIEKAKHDHKEGKHNANGR